jgi:hypothetical protein
LQRRRKMQVNMLTLSEMTLRNCLSVLLLTVAGCAEREQATQQRPTRTRLETESEYTAGNLTASVREIEWVGPSEIRFLYQLWRTPGNGPWGHRKEEPFIVRFYDGSKNETGEGIGCSCLLDDAFRNWTSNLFQHRFRVNCPKEGKYFTVSYGASSLWTRMVAIPPRGALTDRVMRKRCDRPNGASAGARGQQGGRRRLALPFSYFCPISASRSTSRFSSARPPNLHRQRGVDPSHRTGRGCNRSGCLGGSRR